MPVQADNGTYQVTVNCGPNGTISPKGTFTMASDQSFGPIIATPNAGYVIQDWYFNGQAMGWDTPQYMQPPTDSEQDIYVAFERITNWVHVSAGYGGTVQPGDRYVGWGDSLEFTAQPDSTYHVNTWTVDGAVQQVGGNHFTLNDITAECQVSVDFAINTFEVLGRSGPHGSIDPDGVVSVEQGNNQAFSATPHASFSLAGWMVDQVPIVTGPYGYMLVNVQTNHTVQPLFSQPIDYGQTVTNDLVSSLDPDAWMFSGEAGKQLFVTLKAVSSNFTPNVAIYSPDSILLAESSPGTANLTLTNSGDFLILVHGAGYTQTGEYVLSVSSFEQLPTLILQRAGQMLHLSWPSPSTGWRLQQCSDFTAGNWSDWNDSISNDGTNCSITFSPSAEHLFYRLTK